MPLNGNTIIQWNVQGLRCHSLELRRLLLDRDPFAMAIQETKFSPYHNFNLRGYRIFRKDTVIQDRGRAHSGVALIIRENIPVTPIQLATDLQAVAVQIKAPYAATLCCLYLPDRRWMGNQLENLLTQLPSPLILMGDFNAHNPWWGSSSMTPTGRVVEDVIDRSNLVLLNNGAPTHITLSSGTLSAIDLSFCSPPLATALEWSICGELYQSDHFPICITSESHRDPSIPRETWDLKNANWESFRASFNLPVFTGDVEIDDRSFTEAIVTATSDAVPHRRTGGRKRRLVPWWNEDCRRANKGKKKAWNRFNRRPTAVNFLEFKRCRAVERQVVRLSKRESWRDYISTLTEAATASEIWNKVKAVAGRHRPPMIPILTVGDRVYTTEAEVANLLAKHYSTASADAAFPEEFRRIRLEEERTEIELELASDQGIDAPLTKSELERALSRTNETAPGKDGISYTIIKNLPENGKNGLLQLYNEIWSCGVYPSSWREAVVIPLPKEGKDKSLPNSYQPISLTCCLGKVMESMVNYRLNWYLERNSLLAVSQAGYRRRYSTTDQLALLEKVIQDAFINREHVVGVFFDLEKAF